MSTCGNWDGVFVDLEGSGSILSTSGRFSGSGRIANGARIQSAEGFHTGQFTTIEGNFTQTDARLEMEVAGTSADLQYDVLHITGNATIGGTLAISFIDNFAPRSGQQFAILQAEAGILGDFATIEISGLAPGFSYTTAQDNSGRLTLTAQNDGIATSPARLEIGRSGSSLMVSWSSAGNWTLETSGSIPSLDWLTVSDASVRNGDRWTVTLPPGASSGFFRLRQ